MLEHINPQDISNHVLLADKLNEMIDKINESIYVLSIPLNTIKPTIDAKNFEITNKTALLDEKIQLIKAQEKKISGLKEI